MGIESYYKHECVILVKTSVQDSVGGDVGGYEEVPDSNYFGYIGELSRNERVSGGVETETSTNKHRYPVGVVLLKENRIKCLNGDYENKVFDVLPQKTVHGHHKKAELRIVE